MCILIYVDVRSDAHYIYIYLLLVCAKKEQTIHVNLDSTLKLANEVKYFNLLFLLSKFICIVCFLSTRKQYLYCWHLTASLLFDF